MARKLRNNSGDQFYHVINRANARFQIFQSEADYYLFESILMRAKEKFSIDILTHITMPNHFHLVVYPRKDGELSKFMHWFTTTLAYYWHSIHKTIGTGHIFQGRYKSFPIKDERHLTQVLVYVDRNAVRAGLVDTVVNWRWSSAWIRSHGNACQKSMLKDFPIEISKKYYKYLNRKDSIEILSKIRSSVEKSIEIDTNASVKRGRPKK